MMSTKFGIEFTVRKVVKFLAKIFHHAILRSSSIAKERTIKQESGDLHLKQSLKIYRL